VNTENGAIYRGQEAIDAAQARGEPIVRVSERVVKLVEAGQRAEARRKRSKNRRKMKKQSQRANRN